MKSGYVSCACRDCFDLAIAHDTTKGALCDDCEAAGCDPNAPNAIGKECQRTDAYGLAELCEHGNWVCSTCGKGKD